MRDKVEVPPGGRKLTEEDLALVRAQLRAAAQASDAQSSQEGAQRQAAAEFAAAAAHSRRKGISLTRSDLEEDPSATANTCAAAIETLLWFGLALGDKEKEKEAKGRAKVKQNQSWMDGFEGDFEEDYLSENGSLATEVLRGVGSLSELGDWDWEQAMREAGIDEEEANGVPSSESLTVQELSSALLNEEDQMGGCEAQQSLTVKTEPTEQPVRDAEVAQQSPKLLSGIRSEQQEHELARFDSASESSGVSGTPSESGELVGDDRRRTSEGDDTRSVLSIGGDDCDTDNMSSGRTTPRLGYSSPEAASRHATRRSPREPKVQKPWLASMDAPLLKWEKEQQAKPNRAKRRFERGEGEMGFDTDSGDELVNQLISPNALLSDSVLDLVFGTEPKRQCL